MKTQNKITARITPLVVFLYYLVAAPAAGARETGDSIDVSKLLAEAKAEAVELRNDSADLESFTRSKLSWKSQGAKIEMIKEHVNNTGKLLVKLKDAEAIGSPWQRTAISRIESLLKELAANTRTTIDYFNENTSKLHFAEFQDYAKANYQLAMDLETLIRDFVNYGEAKQEAERLGRKMGISD